MKCSHRSGAKGKSVLAWESHYCLAPKEAMPVPCSLHYGCHKALQQG